MGAMYSIVLVKEGGQYKRTLQKMNTREEKEIRALELQGHSYIACYWDKHVIFGGSVVHLESFVLVIYK